MVVLGFGKILAKMVIERTIAGLDKIGLYTGLLLISNRWMSGLLALKGLDGVIQGAGAFIYKVKARYIAGFFVLEKV